MQAKFGLVLCSLLACSLLAASPLPAQQNAGTGWPEWGGALAGHRFSAARQINTHNVEELQVAWTFHTHGLDQPSPLNARAYGETTPVLWQDSLFLDTPFDAVFRVDAATGAQLWTFDPHVSRNAAPYMVVSRGVALWHAAPRQNLPCPDRVFVATLDRRLIALDARSGAPCVHFGRAGTVDLTQGVTVANPNFYFFSSPPVVVGDTVILGSGIADNQALFIASGAVRGFDAVTGRLKWTWEPLPWAATQRPRTAGSGNVWSVPSADPEHDLVFLPTGSPSVDFFGGFRPGDNRDADSIVALRASTGEKVWAFQLVHHDLWDYDTPSQPVLFTWRGSIPAVAVTTKTNMVFVFNRLTGSPLFPVEERSVPSSTIPGEHSWPTQPFSTLPPLGPQTIRPQDIRLTNKADERFCRDVLSHFDNQGMFTPVSTRGVIVSPGNGGGSNWGSSALDTQTTILYTRISNAPSVAALGAFHMPNASLGHTWMRFFQDHAPAWMGGIPPYLRVVFTAPPDKGGQLDPEPMAGTPYKLVRGVLVAPGGSICGPSPAGAIVATDQNSGRQLWSVPIGAGPNGEAGVPGNSGLIATAGHLLFAGSAVGQPFLYAFDSATGQQLWRGPVPVPIVANPMTYISHGRQFVVAVPGAPGVAGPSATDSVVAFALPVKPRPHKSQDLTANGPRSQGRRSPSAEDPRVPRRGPPLTR